MSKCSHRGQVVTVGKYEILAGGIYYLQPKDIFKADIVIALTPVPQELNVREILFYDWPDLEPPPEDFEQFLQSEVIPALEAGKKVLVFCAGGHGRTGTFLACLLALLEPEIEDPVAEIRRRYCLKAVETPEQAAAVMSLRQHLLNQPANAAGN